jgi:hypothetical protein
MEGEKKRKKPPGLEGGLRIRLSFNGFVDAEASMKDRSKRTW